MGNLAGRMDRISTLDDVTALDIDRRPRLFRGDTALSERMPQAR